MKMQKNRECNQINKQYPLVSVCIPVYNHENYVKYCIQGVIDQDYENIELIIIDDGSSDKSRILIEELILECKARFTRFEFRSRLNKGLCATLNEAIEWCKGEYFSVIASDDIWENKKTSEQIRIFRQNTDQNYNIGVISGEITEITEEGFALPHPSHRPPPLTYYDFNDVYFGRARIFAPAAMIKMEALRKTNGYDPDIIIEDWYMWLSITKLGYIILVTDQYYAKYRTHKDNTHKRLREMYKSQKIIDQIFAENVLELDKARKRTARNSFAAAVIYDKKFAMKLMFENKINPFSKDLILSILLLLMPKNIVFNIIKTKRIIFSYFKM